MAGYQNNSDFMGHRQDHDQGNGNNHRQPSPPSVSRMVRIRSAGNLMHPDTEENVEAQTEDVFLNYVYQSYRNDVMRGESDSSTPVAELVNFTVAPITPAAEIGRQLAKLGDDLNEKYAAVFDGMISELNLVHGDADAYETFANIGRRVFASGISWNRILMLLGFGYRMAMSTLRTQASNFATFLSRIVTFICRFVVSERIVTWIAEHGGWRAALSYIPNAVSNMVYVVPGLAFLSVLGVFIYHRFWR